MKNKKILSLIMIVPLLMSAGTNSSFTSNITGGTMTSDIVERVICDGRDVGYGKTNASSDNTAMEVIVDYEFFKMGHSTMYTSWNETYALIYRVYVNLYTSVKWKKNTFLWFTKTYTDNSYLSTISVDLSMKSIPSDFKLLDNYLDVDYYEATYDDDASPLYAGQTNTYLQGGYGMNMTTFYQATPFVDTTRTFFIKSSDVSTASSVYFSADAYYDVLDNSYYSNREVSLYGGYVFEWTSDPTGVSLDVHVECGLDESHESLTADDSTNKLPYRYCESIIADGFQPMNTTYGYTSTFNKTYTIN